MIWGDDDGCTADAFPAAPTDGRGVLGAEIGSFRLYLAAEDKAPKTIRLYTEAVAWFAAARLLGEGKTGWEQADRRDVQERMTWLLGRYSDAYASNQFRALQQFFKWLSAAEDLPDPMARLRPPRVTAGLVPVFTGAELARLGRACAGRGFAQRRDAAVIAVLQASGIRLSELAGIRYDPSDPRRSDLDLSQREITVRGKGGKPRIVKISYDAARAVDRYLRARARHPQAWRAQLWLGAGNRGPLTASGIYQAVVRRGRQCGVQVWPHRFRHHFSHTWQMGRIASDATFPGKCDPGAAGDADPVHCKAEGDSIRESPGQGGCMNAGCIRRIDVASDSAALNDSLLRLLQHKTRSDEGRCPLLPVVTLTHSAWLL